MVTECFCFHNNSCFKDAQLQQVSRQEALLAQQEAELQRRYEVCFKYAEWRMTEEDGQIGISDILLKNFL